MRRAWSCEHDLQPERRRRYMVTTDSDHAGPIYPDLAKDVVPDRADQLWVADLTYVAIPGDFVYLAAILDAWSRKVVGNAISRSMHARIAVAALKAAIRNRTPPKGCIHHSDRGSQYASEVYRASCTTRRHPAHRIFHHYIHAMGKQTPPPPPPPKPAPTRTAGITPPVLKLSPGR